MKRLRRRLRRFLALPATEQRLLLKAAIVLGVIRLGLNVLPFSTLWWLLTLSPRASSELSATRHGSPDRVAWAVAVASPYMLGVRPCLTQALAVQLLLRRRGYAACLRLGVAKGERGQVEAHAWVETGGKVVIGGPTSELERYTPLLALDAKAT